MIKLNAATHTVCVTLQSNETIMCWGKIVSLELHGILGSFSLGMISLELINQWKRNNWNNETASADLILTCSALKCKLYGWQIPYSLHSEKSVKKTNEWHQKLKNV